MSLQVFKEIEGKTALQQDFGLYVKNEKEQFFKIKKVYIFDNNKIYMIDNHFYDNFRNKDYLIINGTTPRKNKIDLSLKSNFIIKAEQERFDFEVMYNLYINATLNNYNFKELKLENTMLNIYYSLNNEIYNHCIGWNNKKSNSIKYNDNIEKLYTSIKYFDASDRFEKDIKTYLQEYKKYIKALDEEKNYTIKDYKKMSLASGTSEEENKTILRNNNFDI